MNVFHPCCLQSPALFFMAAVWLFLSHFSSVPVVLFFFKFQMNSSLTHSSIWLFWLKVCRCLLTSVQLPIKRLQMHHGDPSCIHLVVMGQLGKISKCDYLSNNVIRGTVLSRACDKAVNKSVRLWIILLWLGFTRVKNIFCHLGSGSTTIEENEQLTLCHSKVHRCHVLEIYTVLCQGTGSMTRGQWVNCTVM